MCWVQKFVPLVVFSFIINKSERVYAHDEQGSFAYNRSDLHFVWLCDTPRPTLKINRLYIVQLFNKMQYLCCTWDMNWLVRVWVCLPCGLAVIPAKRQRTPHRPDETASQSVKLDRNFLYHWMLREENSGTNKEMDVFIYSLINFFCCI